MAEWHRSITGSGTLTFSGVDSYGYYRIVVTDFGMAHAISTGANLRYLDIGWFAPFEDVTGDPDFGANFLGPHTFIEYEHSSFSYKQFVEAAQGVSGIVYDLKAGVEIDLWTYSP